MMLTADSHVHSEWSWDTGGPDSEARGTMVRTCERAVRIGLPALVFTEHFDFDDAWRAGSDDFPVSNRRHITEDGYLVPPPLDVDGYLEAIDRCRHQFPGLTILTGVEFGQPHLFGARAHNLVDVARFDRINGSLHTLAVGTDRAEPVTLYRSWSPEDVVWARRLWSWIPQWWTEEGGRAVSFGSDAHVPHALADGFPEAQHMLEHFGFRPGARSEELWTRQVRSRSLLSQTPGRRSE